MEPEDKLDATQKFLETWVERNRINQELLPFVTDELERTNWEIRVRTTLANYPIAGTALPANLNSQVEHKYTYLLSELPMLPEYKPTTFTGLASVGTAVASDFYAFISQPGASLEAKNAFNQSRIEYQELQQKQNRPQQVLHRIKQRSFPELEERFEKAQKAYSAYKGGTMSNSATASEIRNLLHSLNGYLFAKARTVDEQKLKWEEYALRLVLYFMPNHLYQELVRQGVVHNELIQILAPGAKDRKSINIDDVWTRVLDHIFIVLGNTKY